MPEICGPSRALGRAPERVSARIAVEPDVQDRRPSDPGRVRARLRGTEHVPFRRLRHTYEEGRLGLARRDRATRIPSPSSRSSSIRATSRSPGCSPTAPSSPRATRARVTPPTSSSNTLVNSKQVPAEAIEFSGVGGNEWLSLLLGRPAVRALPGPLDLPHQPDAGRRLEGHELRQEPRQAHGRRLAQDHVQGRRGRRRGRRGTARDQGVPREPQEVPGARRAHPEGRAAVRAARHRQDAAGARSRGRGGRAVLLDLRLRLRRDVRRRRRLARARPVRAGQAERALHHLHGRDRRRRTPSRRRPGRRSRRARADAQPAAGRDGRLRAQGQHHPDRGHQPARHPRSRAAAPGPLRPPDRGRPARSRRPQEDPRGAHQGQADRARDRPRRARGADTRVHRRRPREPRQRGRAPEPPAAAARSSARTSSRRGSCA